MLSQHSAHMAVWPHGWKVISHGPSQRKQLGPVTESTSLSSVLLESPPDTETSGGVASLLVGVASLLVGVATLLVGVATLLVGVGFAPGFTKSISSFFLLESLASRASVSKVPEELASAFSAPYTHKTHDKTALFSNVSVSNLSWYRSGDRRRMSG